MHYTSTRDAAVRASGAEAILKGLSQDGGLFVPAHIPGMNFRALKGKGYADVALAVLRVYLPDYPEAFLKDAVAKSYGDNFGGAAGRMHKLERGLYTLELWHGPTAAFKDYALQVMPKLLVEARRLLLEKDETVILVATSGDTGSAALAGYSGLPGIKIAVFYPESGVSALQRLQMTTQAGDNVFVYAVKGNFDDAQRGVKRAFTDAALEETLAQRGAKLSSANSINWGRLVPQIVYYVTSYLHLWENNEIIYGDAVDFCVPTGNFGDILAGWYAKQMGLPVGQLICAANRNNVLADFLQTGVYDANRTFYKTSSPSMDILVSSNLERLLWHAAGDAEKVRGWMEQLAQTGKYQVDESTMDVIRQTFTAGWASEEDVYEEIRRVFKKQHYLCDPHTAVALKVLKDMPVEPRRPSVVLSTASPYKFCDNVLTALDHKVPQDAFEGVRTLEELSGTAAPLSLQALSGKPVRFTEVINPEDIPAVPLHVVGQG